MGLHQVKRPKPFFTKRVKDLLRKAKAWLQTVDVEYYNGTPARFLELEETIDEAEKVDIDCTAAKVALLAMEKQLEAMEAARDALKQASTIAEIIHALAWALSADLPTHMLSYYRAQRRLGKLVAEQLENARTASELQEALQLTTGPELVELLAMSGTRMVRQNLETTVGRLRSERDRARARLQVREAEEEAESAREAERRSLGLCGELQWPSEYLCPIGREPMLDPVVLVGDGFSYERQHITTWLEARNTSPRTGVDLDVVSPRGAHSPEEGAALVPNQTLRICISEWPRNEHERLVGESRRLQQASGLVAAPEQARARRENALASPEQNNGGSSAGGGNRGRTTRKRVEPAAGTAAPRTTRAAGNKRARRS